MSMLLMLVVLLGAALVMAAGVLLTRWGTRERAVSPPAEPEPPQVGEGIGGYSPLPESATEPPRPVLPLGTLTRVRELLALGRDGEAVTAVRRETGLDLPRAREAVELVRRGEIG